MALSPDGKQLVGYVNTSASAEPTVKMWNVASGELQRTYKENVANVGGVEGMRFLPDGKTVLFVGTFRMYVWEIGSAKPKSYEWGLSRSGSWSFRLSADGKTLGRRGFDFVELRSVESGKSELFVKKSWLMHAVLSPDLKRIVVYDPEGSTVFRLPGQSGRGD